MTRSDLRNMSGQEMRDALSRMSKDEFKEIIDTCGIVQEKIAMKRLWESLTGQKYDA